MAGPSTRRIARIAAVPLAAMVAASACGSTAPELVRDGPIDLGPLVGSWHALVRGDDVWQGRWDLHVQAGAMLLVQPDGEILSPGTVDALGPGAIVLGPDLTCDSNRPTPGRGVYSFELTTDGLTFRPTDEGDPCADRRTILTSSTWAAAPTVAMPVRVDARPDASCGPPPDGGPAGSRDPGATPVASAAPATPASGLPIPWELENATAGMLVVVERRADGTRTQLAQAAPGATVTVDPQHGGRWTVADLAGRCLAQVASVARVAVRTGQAPEIEPLGADAGG